MLFLLLSKFCSSSTYFFNFKDQKIESGLVTKWNPNVIFFNDIFVNFSDINFSYLSMEFCKRLETIDKDTDIIDLIIPYHSPIDFRFKLLEFIYKMGFINNTKITNSAEFYANQFINKKIFGFDGKKVLFVELNGNATNIFEIKVVNSESIEILRFRHLENFNIDLIKNRMINMIEEILGRKLTPLEMKNFVDNFENGTKAQIKFNDIMYLYFTPEIMGKMFGDVLSSFDEFSNQTEKIDYVEVLEQKVNFKYIHSILANQFPSRIIERTIGQETISFEPIQVKSNSLFNITIINPINENITNETMNNETIINETSNNETIINETVIDETILIQWKYQNSPYNYIDPKYFNNTNSINGTIEISLINQSKVNESILNDELSHMNIEWIIKNLSFLNPYENIEKCPTVEHYFKNSYRYKKM